MRISDWSSDVCSSDLATVIEADNAPSLLALADAHPDADLLLLDLNMPGAHGFSTLVHLRGSQPQLPIIVVSAREEPAIIRRALDHGASGFIPKSTDSAQMHEAIAEVLAGGTWAPPQASQAQRIDSDEAQIAQRVRELTPQQFRVMGKIGRAHV